VVDLRRVYTALIALGIVSLLGDVIYEGARGVIPAFLKGLGASALAVGVISGAGEAINLTVRLLSGGLADRTGAYWPMTIAGYAMIGALPLLALATGWEVAAILILTERLGKALRSPARDVILSECCREVGRGKAFGIHEFLDQIGAVAGPVILSLVILVSGSYRAAFALMLIPYFVMLAMLLRARRLLGEVKARRKRREGEFSSSSFRAYVAAVCLNTLGLIPAALILYQISAEVGAWVVPLVYALIQLIDAPMALAAGHLYDRTGPKILVVAFVLSIAPAPLTFAGGMTLLLLAAVVFGFILGIQESIYRAFVADIVPVERRGRAYGEFYSATGVAALAGGALFGLLLTQGVGWPAVLVYSAAVNLTGLALLIWSARVRR
jgi:MFS family permease